MFQLKPAVAAACGTLAMLSASQALAQNASGENVVIYGLIDAVTRRATNATASGDSLTAMTDGIFTGSRLGFRARERLSEDLSAIFLMESGYDPSSGVSLQGNATADYGQNASPQRFWGRDLYVGLESKSWSVKAGHQYTLAHLIAAKFQPQGNPNSTAHSLFSSHHIARQDNVLKLDGRFGGFEANSMYTFGENGGSNNSSWGLGAGYTGADYFVGGYVQQMKNLTGSETRKIVGLGGNYRVNEIVQLYAGAMKRSSEASPQTNKVWTVGANFEVAAPVTLSVEYYRDKQSGSAALEGSREVAWVSASYRFSKRTDVYAILDRNEVEDGYSLPSFMGHKGSQTGFGAGLRHKF